MAATVNTERAIALLGQGIPAVQVAAALQCSESYISQLISDESISSRISELRYDALQKHNERDAFYDSLEDKAAKQLERILPTMCKPGEILNAVRTINSLKRRGSSNPDVVTAASSTHVTLVMPSQTIKNFTLNVNNQIVGAGAQELVTATLGAVAAMSAIEAKENGHDTSSQ